MGEYTKVNIRDTTGNSPFGWVRIAGALLARPGLWPTALVVGHRLVPKRWWRSGPVLPLPSADYLAFRSETQYGDPDATPSPADVVAYLEWCRRERHR